MEPPYELSEESKKLWNSLVELHHFCRNRTRTDYSRINPFYEDLFEWSERAEYWTGKKNGTTIYNSATLIGDVRIGAHCWIGPFCMLDGGGGLSIGDHCSVSTGCQLISHDSVKWALSGGKMDYEYAGIRIGDCCFFGAQAIVTKGVTIGNHCLIGAGTVVTSDVDDFSIVGGVPARKIGKVHIDRQGRVKLVYGDD